MFCVRKRPLSPPNNASHLSLPFSLFQKKMSDNLPIVSPTPDPQGREMKQREPSARAMNDDAH